MVEVIARKGEDVDSLLKRFKFKLDREGVLVEAREHEYFISNSMKRHIKDCKKKFRNKINKFYGKEDEREVNQ